MIKIIHEEQLLTTLGHRPSRKFKGKSWAWPNIKYRHITHLDKDMQSYRQTFWLHQELKGSQCLSDPNLSRALNHSFYLRSISGLSVFFPKLFITITKWFGISGTFWWKEGRHYYVYKKTAHQFEICPWRNSGCYTRLEMIVFIFYCTSILLDVVWNWLRSFRSRVL